MLKLQFRDRRRESVWLVDQNFTIGQSADNSLMISDPSILDHHAKITSTLETLTLSNTSGSPKVLLNDKPVSKDSKLKAGDVIKLGDVELELTDPKALIEQQNSGATANYSNGWSIYSSASWLDQNRFVVDKKITLGRDPSCDITLPLEHLSRKHLALEVKGGQLFLEDLGSSNGTFLNGQKVSTTQVMNGDKIKLDVLTFEVSGPAHDPNKTIIRSASPEKRSSDSKNTSSRLSTKIENPKKSVANKKPKTKPKTTKKRLASDGKQDWIAGNNEAKSKADKKSPIGFIITGLVIITGMAAGIYFLL